METNLIALLPYTLQEKVRYYFDFVKDRLFEISVIEGRREVARRYEKDIELIFLLRFLYGFFVLGYRNYEASLKFFEAYNVDGFQIGTTHYSRSAPITLEWFELAEEIEKLIRSSPNQRYMVDPLSTDEIIRQLLLSFDGGEQDYAKEESN